MTGIVPAAAVAGDLVFCHSTGIVSRCIRLAEWLHWRKGSIYNHVAILDTQGADGEWTVIQAQARGVTRGAKLSEIAPGGIYVIVGLPAGCNRDEVLAFARSRAGVRYGFITAASILFNILTPHFIRIDVRRDNTLICSALAALALLAGGWIEPVSDYYGLTPAQLFDLLPAV